MSLHDKLGRATFDLLEVVKTRLAADILQARTEGTVTFETDEQLSALLGVLNGSIEGSFSNGVDHILSVAAQETTTTTKATTTKKRTSRKTKS